MHSLAVLGTVLGMAAFGTAMGPGRAVAQTVDRPAAESVVRGGYVLRAAGCVSCHTDHKNKGPPLAGGRALPTRFGTFYPPNITPDTETGIGGWSIEDLARALREGLTPEGSHYYPAFPYTSYTGMSDQDVGDLWAYLMAQPPVARANIPHELTLPFRFRPVLGIWKSLFFEPGRFVDDSAKDKVWNRGAYLVNALGHCRECHTPRNVLGGVDNSRRLAGTAKGPQGKKVPNITSHPKDGIGVWSESDIVFFLKTGFYPDGDVAGGAMAEVIDDGTSQISDADRAAIAAYLRDLRPLSGP